MNFIPYVILFIVGLVTGAGIQAYADSKVINALKEINFDSLEHWREGTRELTREFDRILTAQEKQIVEHYENRRNR